MRIVHLLPALTKGGGERVAVDLANDAVEDGHEVAMVLAYPVDPALLQGRLDRRVELRFLLGRPSRVLPYFALPGWIRRHWAWLASRDIVHCHLTFGTVAGSMIQATRGLRKAERPVVVETYHAAGMNIPRWRRRWDASRLAKRDAVALVAEDGFWAEFLNRNCDQVARVIPNGVSGNPQPSKTEIERSRKAIGLPRDAFIVGSIGRLLAERRPDKVLEAFLLASRQLPSNVHLLLGGDGPQRDALRRRAEKSGLSNRVHLPGLIERPATVFPLIDLYLTVNIGSLTGIAAIEAAMAGCSIVAFQMIRAHDGSDDWIWSSSDPACLGARIRELILDPGLRRRVGAAQRGHALKHFSVTKMAQAYERLYSAALAQPRLTKEK